MLKQVKQIVSRADLGICHLEQPLTAGTPSGEPVFQAPQGLAGAIAWTGWDACSTASNHSLDGGIEGIDFTLKRLDRVGVAHSGTNASPSAPRAAMLQAKGVKVALLAYTDLIPGLTPPEEGWRLNLADPKRMLADARRARRAGADVVLVSLHWGTEYQHEPLGVPAHGRPQAHRLARRDRGDRPARARGAADPASERQAGGLRRGQPALQPDRELLPAREPGRDGGAARAAVRSERHRRQARALRAHRGRTSRASRSCARAAFRASAPSATRAGARG